MSDFLLREQARARHQELLREAAEHALFREARAARRLERRQRFAALMERLRMLSRRLRKLPAA